MCPHNTGKTLEKLPNQPSKLKLFTGTALMRTGTHQHQQGLELKLSVTKAKSSVHPCSAQRKSEPRKPTVTRSIKAHNNPPKKLQEVET